MAIREGRWDCERCGTRGVLGRHVQCTECGSSRPHGVRFYLPADAEEVTDARRLAEARAGPDWVCAHCTSSNRDAEPSCQSCGAPRGLSPRQEVRDYALAGVPRSASPRTPVYPQRGVNVLPSASSPEREKWADTWVRLLVLAWLVLLPFLVFLSIPREVPGRVAEVSWERTITLEEYRTVTETGWHLPEGGRLVSRDEAIHHYEQVLEGYRTESRQVSEQVQTGTRSYTCGTRDRGNGYFEDVTCTEPVYETQYRTVTEEVPVYRSEPVYQTQYRYEIERWLPGRTLREAERSPSPRWPAVELAPNEREAEQLESFRVRFVDERGKEYVREMEPREWASYREGDPVTLRVRRMGGRLIEVEKEESR